jgi:Arc/MetJ-type ribon-helix-helix transcriptional regulator
MQTIEIADELLDKMKELCREGGYDSVDAWLKEAVEDQLISLRRGKAEGVAKLIREGLHSRGHTEEEILNDFEVFRARLRRDANQT